MTRTAANKAEDLYRAKRNMMERNLRGRDILDPRVLNAMETVPRESFVPPEDSAMAYDDCPLSIGYGQTISQPYIVALMAQKLDIQPEEKVLEIGAGCGYQAAVLSCLAAKVYTVEIIDELACAAQSKLMELGYGNVVVIHADGTHGWEAQAPYQKIIAAATARKTPQALEDQLAEGGRIIIPVGADVVQNLVLGEKNNGVVEYETVTLVRFVPMTGDARKL